MVAILTQLLQPSQQKMLELQKQPLRAQQLPKRSLQASLNHHHLPRRLRPAFQQPQHLILTPSYHLSRVLNFQQHSTLNLWQAKQSMEH